MGDEGEDNGEIARELWNLFGIDLKAVCEGTSNKLVFSHSSAKSL